jgi:hypothetical protein
MRNRTPQAFLFSALAVSASFAQTTTQTTPRTFTATRNFMAPHFMMPVTGAPYSGAQSNENLQILADGTKLSRPPMVIQNYRDSAGRTRTEQPAGPADSGAVFIEIYDPVANVRYILDPVKKVAHKSTIPDPPQRRQPGLAPNVIPNAAGTDARTRPLPQSAGAAPAPAGGVTGGVMGGTVSAGGGMGGSVSAGVMTTGDRSMPAMSHESLGQQTIEGVVAEGNRTTMVYPAGSMRGNDRPLTVTNESWFSKDLKTVILMKSNDPAMGENTMRLINLSRAEPDPSLFQPPPDYTVVEETGNFSVQISIPMPSSR